MRKTVLKTAKRKPGTRVERTVPLKKASVVGARKKTAGKTSVKRGAGTVYLTERQLIAAARQGFTDAARTTMAVMGQNWIVRNGWVGVLHSNGSFTRKQKLQRPSPLRLD